MLDSFFDHRTFNLLKNALFVVKTLIYCPILRNFCNERHSLTLLYM